MGGAPNTSDGTLHGEALEAHSGHALMMTIHTCSVNHETAVIMFMQLCIICTLSVNMHWSSHHILSLGLGKSLLVILTAHYMCIYLYTEVGECPVK